MSLFGGLYVGTSGLQTSQNALNTVAHNMVNADTLGYTRQQVAQTTRSYNTISTTNSAISYQQVGLGVNYAEVRQIRDAFLDKSYRKESGRQGFYDVSCDAIEEVEGIFQELDGEAFANTLTNLWIAVQELDKDPSNTVNQGIFIQRCSEFATRSQAVYEDLCSYQDDLNFDVKQKVDKINSIGDQIVDLNLQILKVESSQVEHANDMRDQRNALIDELSGYANIKTYTDVDGNIIVKLEGIDFINSDSCKRMEIFEDPATGFYTPYWKAFAREQADGSVDISSAKVFNLEQEISTDMDTDIGGLKSILLARGDHRATFTDLAATKGPGVEYTYSDIKDSVVMNVMAEFDQLVHDITTGINEVIYNAAMDNRKTAPGSNYLFDPMTNEPYQVFSVSAKTNPIIDGKYSDSKDYTTSNIIINDTLKQSPSLLGFIRPDGIADQTCADKLKELFTSETHTLNPEVKTATNLVNYYDNLISQVSNTGYIMRGISANQEITVTNISAAREEILGVSTDEELSNMIMFQNAFNASSRYINVVSELLEHIINTLGM